MNQAQGSNIFKGFSQEEIHEILIEMPQLKQMKKEKYNIAVNGTQPPVFSKAQLIHLDSLNDIANRGQAELRKRVMEQINNRRSRINNSVHAQDQKYDFNDPKFAEQKSNFTGANAALLKKFAQAAKDGNEEELPRNYNFHETLKTRLNFADARAQQQLFDQFKDEDFVNKIWDEGVPHHTALDSERVERQLKRTNTQKLAEERRMRSIKGDTLTDKIGEIFNEQQQNLHASQEKLGLNA